MSTAMPQGLTNMPSQLADLLSCLDQPSFYTEKFSRLFSNLPQELSSQFSNRLVSLLRPVRTSLPSSLTSPPPEILGLSPNFSARLTKVTSMITIMLGTIVTTFTVSNPSDILGNLFSKSITALHTALYVNTPSNLPTLLNLLEDALTHPPTVQPYSTLTSFPSEVSSLLRNPLPSNLHPLAIELNITLGGLVGFMHIKLGIMLNRMNQDLQDALGDRTAVAYDPLEQLPVQYVYETREDADTDPDTCLICLEDMKDGDNARRLGCSHNFHLQCIDRWLETKTSCPLCRTPIDATND